MLIHAELLAQLTEMTEFNVNTVDTFIRTICQLLDIEQFEYHKDKILTKHFENTPAKNFATILRHLPANVVFLYMQLYDRMLYDNLDGCECLIKSEDCCPTLCKTEYFKERCETDECLKEMCKYKTLYACCIDNLCNKYTNYYIAHKIYKKYTKPTLLQIVRFVYRTTKEQNQHSHIISIIDLYIVNTANIPIEDIIQVLKYLHSVFISFSRREDNLITELLHILNRPIDHKSILVMVPLKEVAETIIQIYNCWKWYPSFGNCIDVSIMMMVLTLKIDTSSDLIFNIYIPICDRYTIAKTYSLKKFLYFIPKDKLISMRIDVDIDTDLKGLQIERREMYILIKKPHQEMVTLLKELQMEAKLPGIKEMQFELETV